MAVNDDCTKVRNGLPGQDVAKSVGLLDALSPVNV